MSISLYEVSVGSYLQGLGAVSGVLDKGQAHCAGGSSNPNELLGCALIDDMLPLAFQLTSVVHHSLGAIEGMQSGEFGPPTGVPEHDYAGWQALIEETKSKVAAYAADEINALSGGTVMFKLGDTAVPFTTENFALSFSLPNFHFHAATAYDILRTKGVTLGKRDYMGRMKIGV